jgi:hypothetical protein
MNKQDALKKLTLLEKETKELRKIIEQPESLFDRIKTWGDVCREKNINENILPYRNPQNKLQRQLNATVKINIISELFNEGIIMDFNNRNQYKYYPYFTKESSGWVVVGDSYGFCYFSFLGSGFYYKDSKTALYCGNTFKDIYLDYLPE